LLPYVPAAFTEDNPTGMLAMTIQAIVNRGARCGSFDLCLTLHQHTLGVAECVAVVGSVIRQVVGEPLLLRSLACSEEADRAARPRGEGPEDWRRVKDVFETHVGRLLVPPPRPLDIQIRIAGVRARPAAAVHVRLTAGGVRRVGIRSRTLASRC